MGISTSDHSHDRFATTRWSLVMHLAAADSADARLAMNELAQRYWYPIYAYVRHGGHPPNAAEGVARSFLTTLLKEFADHPLRPTRGLFRRYLLDQLDRFLRGDWQHPVETAGFGELSPPADLELRYLRDHGSVATPEQAYHRSFAQEILSRAFKRLRNEAERAGHGDMYAMLEPYLALDPTSTEYEDIAGRLNQRALPIVVALKRLRQRFRELVSEELADTVTSPEELESEQVALHAVMRDAPER